MDTVTGKEIMVVIAKNFDLYVFMKLKEKFWLRPYNIYRDPNL